MSENPTPATERERLRDLLAAAEAQLAGLRATVARQQAIIAALMPDCGRHAAGCPTCGRVGSVDPERE